MKPIRVLEIRAAQNGWVISAFETEANYRNDMSIIFTTMVAETAEKVGELVLEMTKSDDWQRDLVIPPARRNAGT